MPSKERNFQRKLKEFLEENKPGWTFKHLPSGRYELYPEVEQNVSANPAEQINEAEIQFKKGKKCIRKGEE